MENIISSSNNRTIIIRAGYSNIVFFLGFVFYIFLNKLFLLFEVNITIKYFAPLLIFIFVMIFYKNAISKIAIINNEKLLLENPFREIEYDLNEITALKIYGFPLAMSILMKITTIRNTWPKFYFFPAISTNCGAFEETKSNLLILFRGWGSEREL